MALKWSSKGVLPLPEFLSGKVIDNSCKEMIGSVPGLAGNRNHGTADGYSPRFAGCGSHSIRNLPGKSGTAAVILVFKQHDGFIAGIAGRTANVNVACRSRDRNGSCIVCTAAIKSRSPRLLSCTVSFQGRGWFILERDNVSIGAIDVRSNINVATLINSHSNSTGRETGNLINSPPEDAAAAAHLDSVELLAYPSRQYLVAGNNSIARTVDYCSRRNLSPCPCISQREKLHNITAGRQNCRDGW